MSLGIQDQMPFDHLLPHRKQKVQTSADRSLSTPYNNGEGIYGGPNDLWGLTWTPTQINTGSFGVAFAAKGNTFVGVDAISVTVYYTP